MAGVGYTTLVYKLPQRAQGRVTWVISSTSINATGYQHKRFLSMLKSQFGQPAGYILRGNLHNFNATLNRPMSLRVEALDAVHCRGSRGAPVVWVDYFRRRSAPARGMSPPQQWGAVVKPHLLPQSA